jgi:hypothetical protein
MSNTKQTATKPPDATRHGLTSSAVLLKDENPADYQTMRKRIWDDLKPEGGLEEELTERAVCCLWRLGRLNRLEVEAMEELGRQALVNNHLVLHELLETSARKYTRKHYMNWACVPQMTDEFYENVDKESEVMKEGLVESVGRGLVQDRSAQTMLLLRRYENSLERSFYAALARLEAIQSERKREAEKAKQNESPAVDLVLEAVREVSKQDADISPDSEAMQLLERRLRAQAVAEELARKVRMEAYEEVQAGRPAPSAVVQAEREEAEGGPHLSPMVCNAVSVQPCGPLGRPARMPCDSA